MRNQKNFCLTILCYFILVAGTCFICCERCNGQTTQGDTSFVQVLKLAKENPKMRYDEFEPLAIYPKTVPTPKKYIQRKRLKLRKQ